MTDFMLTLALRETEIALTERQFFALSDEDYAHFLAVLERPAQAKPEVERMVKRNRAGKWKVTK